MILFVMTDQKVSPEDIEKLASLSRMKLTEEEKSRYAQEIGSILGYVTQIQEVTDGASTDSIAKTPDMYPHRNVLREDVDNRDLNDDTSELVKLAPRSHDGYVQVKKILN
jgi:aspartyl-tRNA(Asn)/glutamyl-tRNA(Gln) amidotransferase subunit C